MENINPENKPEALKDLDNLQKDKLNDGGNKMEIKKILNIVDQAKETLDKTTSKVKWFVKDHPFKTAAIAAGTGIAIGTAATLGAKKVFGR